MNYSVKSLSQGENAGINEARVNSKEAGCGAGEKGLMPH